MKPRGWNSQFLEVGFTRAEAIVLTKSLIYLCDNPIKRTLDFSHLPETEFSFEPKKIDENIILDRLRQGFTKVVRAKLGEMRAKLC